jgi:hypothetical protein
MGSRTRRWGMGYGYVTNKMGIKLEGDPRDLPLP